MPYVSVIIPYYKKLDYLKKTLASINNQTYRNYEIIIVYDDEKKDELKKIFQLTKNKKKIKIIINKKNLGAGKSRNKGANLARGKYLAFIDADDIWKKNKIRDQIKFMKHNKLKISHTSYSIINEKGQKISKRDIKYKLSYKDLINSCDIGLSTVIISKRLFLQHKFSANKTKEDYSLWLRISKKINIYGLKKELMLWRKTSNSLSSNILQKFYDAFDIYFNQEKFNFTTSVYRVLILSLNFLKKNNKQN
tara:strand:- start:9960 stop:10709 length:750 start_codon:yes stop_codon:yes gene_type:complete